MAVRSLPGFLATLLGVCAAVAFGLTVSRLGPSPGWAEHAAWLRGGLVAGSALGLGVAAWGMLSVGEAVGGRRGVALAAGLALLAAPLLVAVAAEAYWARRSYVSVWRADGGSGAGGAGLWRGTLGGECGVVTVVRVRLGADGRGEGTAVPTSVFSPLYTAVVALSPLDGPGSIPVRARLRDGQMEVWTSAEAGWWKAGELLGSATVVQP